MDDKTDEPGAIVTMRVNDARAKVAKGSVHGKCQKCGEPIWLAPSSVNLLQARPQLEVICFQCADDHISAMKAKGEEINVGTAKGAWQEIEKYFADQN